MRGVGDEVSLRLDHLVGLGPSRVELAEHAVERAGELGDLVLGPLLGDAARGISGGRDLAGRRSELGDRAQRPAGEQVAGDGGDDGPGDDPGDQEEPQPADRGLDRVRAARVLHVDRRLEPVARNRDRRDLQIAARREAGVGAAEVRRAGRDAVGHGPTVEVHEADVGEGGGGDLVEVRNVHRDARVAGGGDLRRDRLRAGVELAVEVAVEPVRGEAADDEGEADQRHARQPREDRGEAPAKRPAPRVEERAAADRGRRLAVSHRPHSPPP